MEKCILCEKNFKKRELIGILVDVNGRLVIMNHWDIRKVICIYCAFQLKNELSIIDFENIEIESDEEVK